MQATLFIIALLLSLILTNIINHWHQMSSLNLHRVFTAQLNAAHAERMARQTMGEDDSPLPKEEILDEDHIGASPPGLMGPEARLQGRERHSLAQLSFEPFARHAMQTQRQAITQAGKAPVQGVSTQRLELKSEHISLVKWCILVAMVLTVVAFFTESFAVYVEGLVGILIESQPGMSARRGFSLFTMGNDLSTSSPTVGWFVQQYHRVLFLMLVGVMPVLWLCICLVIWLVPMEPQMSHTFGLLAQVAYCYTGMDVLVIAILATIFQLGAAIEFQFASMTALLDSVIANYFAEFVPATSVTGVHTTISLGAAFEVGIVLVVVAALLGTAAGWTVMYTHQRVLHEEMFLFPVQPLERMQRKAREVRLLALGAAAMHSGGRTRAATSYLPASASDREPSERSKSVGHIVNGSAGPKLHSGPAATTWTAHIASAFSRGSATRSRTEPTDSFDVQGCTEVTTTRARIQGGDRISLL
jgi:hypothetical protein